MRQHDPIPYGITDGFGYSALEDALGMIQDERELWQEARTEAERRRVMQMRDERRAREARERSREEWSRTRAAQLLRQLGECFEAYKECLAEDPAMEEKGLEFDAANQKIFNRMRITLERANNAPRCRYEKAGGGTCRAPRVRGKKYCHMHLMLEEARPEKIQLPSLGDANAIQAAIAKGAQAAVDGKLDLKQASILAYYLQLAVSNIGRVDFEAEESRNAEAR